MKDWYLRKPWCSTAWEREHGEHYLMHRHKDSPPGYCVYLRGLDEWLCKDCGKVAPDEISFIALLGRCIH